MDGAGSGTNSPLPQSTFQSQQHLAKRYIKTGIIGRGTFGTVYRGIDNEDEQKREVAIKVMDLESIEDDINNIMQEIIALRDCQSEHVPKYYHSFNIGPELWIVMEYMGGGSVHDYLDPKEGLGLESENLIAIIIREVTKGLHYLHELKMIHRDIKAANILLNDDGAVKLADFGVVGRLTETIEKRMTMIGSPYWMAPEVIVPEKGKDDGYGTPADIWSLGILAIEMAHGIPPHGDQHPFEAMRRIMEGPPPTLDDNLEWTDTFRDFLSTILIKDPKKRKTAADLLKHPWLKECGDVSELKEDLIDAMKEFDTFEDSYYENENESGTRNFDGGTVDFSGGTMEFQGTVDFKGNEPQLSSALSAATTEDSANHTPEATETAEATDVSKDVSKDAPEDTKTNTSLTQKSAASSANSSLSGINANKLNKGKQYSQSSRHVMRLSGSPIGAGAVGAAIGGPRHSRQFSKRKSQAAASRAHKKLHKNRSYNMSIEWTNSSRSSIRNLLPPSTTLDLYGDDSSSPQQQQQQQQQQAALRKKSKSKSTSNAPNPQRIQPSDSETDDNNYDAGTMVTKNGNEAKAYLTQTSKAASTPTPIAMYDVGIQTERPLKLDKSVQTDTHTVAHLVGIRKEIFSICEEMETQLSKKGKEQLGKLKEKIKEMTHLKITERRMKSVSIEDAQEAQRRTNEIRAGSQITHQSDMQQTQEKIASLKSKLKGRKGKEKGQNNNTGSSKKSKK